LFSAGDYTLIISPFTSGILGSFSGQVDSSHPLELEAIAQEGAGMYRKTIKGSWKAGSNAGGSPKFGMHGMNPKIKILVSSVTQMRCLHFPLPDPVRLSM
jgi:calpain-7